VFGEATVGSVEDEVVLMDSGGDGFGAKLFEETEEGFRIRDGKFDLGFTGHGEIVREEATRDQ